MLHALQAAEEAIARGDVRATHRHLAEVTPRTPAEALRVGLVKAQVALQAGDARRAARQSRQWLATARTLGDPSLEVEALVVHAQVASHLRRELDVGELLQRAAQLAPPGSPALARVRARQALHLVLARDFDGAERKVEEAQALYRALGDAEGVASLELSRANARARERRFAETEAALEASRAVLLDGPVRSTQAGWHGVQAQLAWLRGDPDTALQALERARDRYEQLGMVPQQVDCATNLAEVLRSLGRLTEARDQYRRMLSVDHDPGRTFFPRLNLAICLLALGEREEAAALAERLLADEQQERATAWVDAVLHAIAIATASDPRDAADALTAAEQALRAAPRVADPDLPDVLRVATEHMTARGWNDLAARIGSLALDHYSAQGRDDEAEAARQALQSLRDAGASAWLGGIRLVRSLGKGGMGEVYEGIDVARERPIAVKVIRSDGTRGETLGRAVASLEREMRGVAGLDHPGIVDVLDTGVVSEGAAALSRGRLLAGSPWIAMELVTGGTLRRLRGRADWPTLRGVLLALLDALAHAHARGLVHLDLKPANVLVDRTAGLAVKLTDFGISRGFREPTARTLDGGTPRYMAPEQFLEDGRRIGPWTDLYALGCVAMELASGTAPFQGETAALRDAHLHQPPPPLVARCAVPQGFEAWLGRLLCKHPMERFLRAADAALALHELDGQPLVRPAEPEPLPEAPLASDTFVLDDLLADASVPARVPEVPAASPLAVVPASRCPPFAEIPWARRERRGVALFAWRTPRPIGQRSAKEALWGALHRVHRTRRAHWLEVAAPSGVGGEWLIRWLLHRGHEVGASSPVVLRSGESLEASLRAPLGATGLHGEALVEHLSVRGLRWGCTRDELEVMARSLDEGTVFDHADLWVGAVCRERPVTWWVDAPDAALRALLPQLVGRGWPLLVLTRVDPLDAPGAPEAPETLSVEPVVGHVLRRGLERALLEPSLAYELAELCEGCDAAAHEVLNHHLARAELLEGPAGLARRPDLARELRLPETPAWTRRLVALRSEASPEVWAALEWVCAAPGPLPDDLVHDPVAHGELVRRGWVRATASGWRPRVAALRQRVLDPLRDEGRLPGLSASLVEHWAHDTAGRAALHQRAGQAEAAEVDWRATVEEALDAGDRPRAVVMLRRWRRIARQLGLARTDPRRVAGEALALRVERDGDT